MKTQNSNLKAPGRKADSPEGCTSNPRTRRGLPGRSQLKIIKSLNKTIESVNKDLDNYRFGKAAHTLYDFFWHDFCDKFIEESKDKNDPKTKDSLIYVLLTSLKLLHPFIPFISEEIYQKLPLKNKKQCLMIEQWPK